MKKLLGLFVALVYSGDFSTLIAQEVDPNCKKISYENRNQTDYGPLRVAVWSGVPSAIPKGLRSQSYV